MVLNDLVGKARDGAQIFECKLSCSIDHVKNFERAISKLSHLDDPEARLDAQGLVASGKLV